MAHTFTIQITSDQMALISRCLSTTHNKHSILQHTSQKEELDFLSIIFDPSNINKDNGLQYDVLNGLCL